MLERSSVRNEQWAATSWELGIPLGEVSYFGGEAGRFKTGFSCIALAVLELVLSARIKSVLHQRPAKGSFLRGL